MEIAGGLQITPSVTLVRQLSAGGMGSVWIAHHSGLDVEVAVKFLLGEHMQDAALRARFAQEAAAASKVKSSHVVKMYDYGVTDDGIPYLVMELLDGTDLRHLLDECGRLPPDEALLIVTQLCRALERAHEAKIVHRDIKPENVFLCTEGGERFVKLLDFGIAKSATTLDRVGGHQSTLVGQTLGTPFYMSPEQFRNAKETDPRSDLWSVGVLTYEAITGTLPFMADTIGALAIVVNDGAPLPPSHHDADLPARFDEWFAKACAHEPASRYASARELVDALREAFALTGPPSTEKAASPRRVVVKSGVESDTATAASASLRETAFANESTASAKPARKARAAILVVVAGLALGGIALSFALRSPRRPPAENETTQPTTASPIAPTVAPADPSASVAASASTAIATSTANAASSAIAAPSSKPVALKHTPLRSTAAPPTVTAQPRKKDVRDIY